MTTTSVQARSHAKRVFVVAALSAALLANVGCRGPHRAPRPMSPTMAPPTTAINTLPPQAFTGQPGDGTVICPPSPILGIGAPDAPLPRMIAGPWKPPGLAGPWPYDEYLFDGGDRETIATVGPEYQVGGLELEDTIVHFDTLQGQTLVEPSNRVTIYSPRFGSVRRVDNLRQDLQNDALVAYARPEGPIVQNDGQLAATALQPEQPIAGVDIEPPLLKRLSEGEGLIRVRAALAEFVAGYLAHEDFQVIRTGIIDEAEMARLATNVDNALAWTDVQAVQVILDNQSAAFEISDQKAQATYRVDLPEHPRLRVIKTASTNMARPGDEVDFTIRFDNTGDSTIGNVTLLDNLTTRLEYLPDTAQASRDAEFFTQRNEGGSLVLRWEFAEPLKPGDGGVVRFHCRVR